MPKSPDTSGQAFSRRSRLIGVETSMTKSSRRDGTGAANRDNL